MFSQVIKLLGLNEDLYHGNRSKDERDGFGLQLFYGTPFYLGTWTQNQINGEGLLYLNQYIFMIGKFYENQFFQGRICWQQGLYYQGKIYNEIKFEKGEFCFKEKLFIKVEFNVKFYQYHIKDIEYIDDKYNVYKIKNYENLDGSGFGFNFKFGIFTFIEYYNGTKNIKMQLSIKTPFQFLFKEFDNTQQQNRITQIINVFYYTVSLNNQQQLQNIYMLNGVNFIKQEDNNEYYNINLHNLEEINILSKFKIPQNYFGDFTLHQFKIKELIFLDCIKEYSLCENFTKIGDLNCVKQHFNFKKLYKKLLLNERLVNIIAIYIEELGEVYSNFLWPYISDYQKLRLCPQVNNKQFGKFKTSLSKQDKTDLLLNELFDLYSNQNFMNKKFI